MNKIIISFTLFIATSFLSHAWALEPFANPTVIGPVEFNLPAGGDDHNYPFFSQADWLADKNYVEEEFFLEGNATSYDRAGEKLAEGIPYKTRMLVRRPGDAKAFNGTVLVEWQNVTAGNDLDALWSGFRDDLVADGYVWVGVSAQRVGVNQLREWSPKRYGSLDVTNNGTVERDAISWDIFGQSVQAIKSPKGVNPLPGFEIQEIIGEGASQSAAYLAPFYNNVLPQHSDNIDLLFLAIGGGDTRDDLTIPVFRTLSETDVLGRVARSTEAMQNDDQERVWEMAGTSHSGYGGFVARMDIAERDFGARPSLPVCDMPAYSRIPTDKVYRAAYAHMVAWIRDGKAPPVAPVIDRADKTLARDEYGNTTGGIQVAEHAAPLAMNTGANSGEARFCRLYGAHVPFTEDVVKKLYPSETEYMAKVKSAVEHNVAQGYILKADGEKTLRTAKEKFSK
ncbi:alpha/beta hydrolase domain-containing protein [Aurantivibrio infirmus]